ncbi:hypothetical protein BUALT_Bualt04G0032100 [Buddleja alternifolia]|uniref:NAB domain-containing protein n=1 Tax=Buddleja alternifolia TaxID=168488 RepID=A0AAV6XM96_9LAMI|nr:hypothetical protein BUALT_Bualt04G0032100 [Buddleja alternifolia]
MEEKVQSMLQLIEEDGDSFAKRAEMYYKRRPELISTVEEAYKAFRALADRYDLLSKELQNANHTIANVFPEQVQFAIDEDDDCPNPKIPRNPQIPGRNMENVPKVPNAPVKEFKGIISTASKKFQGQKISKKAENPNKTIVKSGLTKDEALKEIDKLQKDILALQTVKEFVKSSYETGLAKYWGIENQITDMQQKVCSLEDEFNVDTVIEDNDARTLMAEAALKSCQETLAVLQEKQEKSSLEAKEEYKRIETACQRLKSLRQKYLHGKGDEENLSENDNKGDEFVIKETDEIEELKEKTEKSFNLGNLTVTELAEKIDQLVNKVISLETAVSSQTVLVNTLRTATDDLNVQIQTLEDEKETLVDETQNLGTKVKEMEEKLNKLHGMNKNVERQNSNLQTNFAEARLSLDHLSEKLSSVKPDEEVPELDSSDRGPGSPSEEKMEEEVKDKKDIKEEDLVDVKEVDINVHGSDKSVVKKELRKSETFLEKKYKERILEDSSRSSDKSVIPKQGEVKKEMKKSETFMEKKLKERVLEDRLDDIVNVEEQGNKEKDEEELNWQQLLLSGMEDREKILLKEYTTILRNYKEVKRKLGDVQKKERDSQFDITLQMRELKKAITKRDEEIQSLRQKLNSDQENEDVKRDDSDLGVKPESQTKDLDLNEDVNIYSTPNTEDDEIKFVFIDRTPSVSVVEEKLRTDIDAILDENLDFWLRFSTAFHRIQKFRTEVQDLKDEISKLKEKKKQEGNNTTQVKSEVRPIYKHLREIQTELNVWLDKSASLKDELKRRFASLCNIQEEITKALKEGVEEDEIKFSSHQAAKFQGEILNMKQENNKVREELQAGLDHVGVLQIDIEKTLRKLNHEFGFSSDQPENLNRPKVPLRSFIFGTKSKKPKNSIFSCMHPNRTYQVLKDSVAPLPHR